MSLKFFLISVEKVNQNYKLVNPARTKLAPNRITDKMKNYLIKNLLKQN